VTRKEITRHSSRASFNKRRITHQGDSRSGRPTLRRPSSFLVKVVLCRRMCFRPADVTTSLFWQSTDFLSTAEPTAALAPTQWDNRRVCRCVGVSRHAECSGWESGTPLCVRKVPTCPQKYYRRPMRRSHITVLMDLAVGRSAGKLNTRDAIGLAGHSALSQQERATFDGSGTAKPAKMRVTKYECTRSESSMSRRSADWHAGCNFARSQLGRANSLFVVTVRSCQTSTTHWSLPMRTPTSISILAGLLIFAGSAPAFADTEESCLPVLVGYQPPSPYSNGGQLVFRCSGDGTAYRYMMINPAGPCGTSVSAVSLDSIKMALSIFQSAALSGKTVRYTGTICGGTKVISGGFGVVP
jgi:hypothetical protein